MHDDLGGFPGREGFSFVTTFYQNNSSIFQTLTRPRRILDQTLTRPRRILEESLTKH